MVKLLLSQKAIDAKDSTIYVISFQTVFTNQFSVTKHSKVVGLMGETGLPGVFVMYELSPMMVKYTEKQRLVFCVCFFFFPILFH